MKRILITIVSIVASLSGFTQSQGISYQAIIINSEVKELPGVDIEGSYLPSTALTVRFSILNESGMIDYQEEHSAMTDAYGMINLIIGKGITTSASPVIFNEIDWDGTPKDLQVEISIGESSNDFTEFSFQELTFVPYAYHRNITATGDLTVGGQSTFNGEVEFQDITVEGTADMNGPFNVNNGSPTNLSGDLTVEGDAAFNGSSVFQEITVLGLSDLEGGLNVNNSTTTNLSGPLNTLGTTNLFGDLVVQQTSTLNNSLVVNSTTGLNGQVTIIADVNGTDSNYDAYPLRVEGSNQGVAIRVDGNRNNSNNFVTFWDANGIQGRIEGQTTSEVYTEAEYIFDQSIYAAQTVAQIANLATALAAAVVDPGNAIIEGVNSATLAAEIVGYNVFAFSNLGVTYESGSGDYAEWLPRLDPNEEMEFGQVVGVYGGSITKRTDGASMVMVVSRSPIVLGNMPPDNVGTSNCEKVGFMGQVPVWVIGEVTQGDYILPSGGNNGFAIAKHPTEMILTDYQRIVGVAWSSDAGSGLKLVNVAIGLNTNDISHVVAKQQDQIAALNAEIAQLQTEQMQTNEVLAQLIPGYKNELEKRTGKSMFQKTDSPSTFPAPSKGSERENLQNLPGVTVTRAHIEKSIAILEEKLVEGGIDLSKHPIFSRMRSDPTYKDEVIAEAMELVRLSKSRVSDTK